MAHEFESGFFAGRAAWHGLGTLVADAPSVDAAVALAGLDWTVSLRRVATEDGADCAEARAVVRQSDGRVLGVVGTDFRPIQNSAVFDWFRPFVDAGARMETAGSLRGGRRIWALARLPADARDVGSGDTVAPYVLLAHGHDGTLTLRCGLTPVRVVCANTLSAAIAGSPGLLRVRHTARAGDRIADARESIARTVSAFDARIDLFRAMRARQLDRTSWREYLRRVIPPQAAAPEEPAALVPTVTTVADGAAILASILDGSAPAIPAPARRKASPKEPRAWAPVTQIFETDDTAGRNLWGAVNAVTGWIDHERGADDEKRLDATWFGSGSALRQRAMDVATEMVGATSAATAHA